MSRLMSSVVASLLLGCSFLTAAQQAEIRISWWGGNSRHQATLKALELFEKKNPDIKVKAEYAGWDGYLSRLTVQIAGGSEPDVIQTNWNWLPLFSKKGTGFYDLNTLNNIIDLSQYEPASLGSVTIDNKLNGIPVAITARSFFYNKKLWEDMGVSYPHSWQELFAAGKDFKEKDVNKYPLVLDYMESLTMAHSWMVQKYNIPAIDEQKVKFNYTPEQWVEFFQIYKDLVDSHVFPSMRILSSYGKSNTWEMKPWIEGEWGGVYMWNANVVMYENNLIPPYNKLELGPFVMLPKAKDAGLFLKPTLMFSIGKSTKYPEAAAKLVDFLMNDPQGVVAMGLERGTPLSKKAYEQLSASGLIQTDNITVSGINSSLALPHDIAVSPYFDNPQFVELWHTTIQNLDLGKITVQEAATTFSRSAELILKRVMK